MLRLRRRSAAKTVAPLRITTMTSGGSRSRWKGVGFGAKDDGRAAGSPEPALEPLRLRGEAVAAAEHFPELCFLTIREEFADTFVDRIDGLCLVALEKFRVRIASAMLHEGAIGEPDHRGSVAQPFLERGIFRELVEIVALASDAHPESDARRIAQRPQHRNFVVAEQHGGVGSVSSVTQGADAEWAVVDQVTEEDGSPAVRRVRFERFEQALEVAMDVAGDEYRQIVSSHSPMLIGPRK